VREWWGQRGAARWARRVLGGRRQARAREQPATEAAIVVAVRRACGAVLRACIRDQAADLAGWCTRTRIVLPACYEHPGNVQRYGNLSQGMFARMVGAIKWLGFSRTVCQARMLFSTVPRCVSLEGEAAGFHGLIASITSGGSTWPLLPSLNAASHSTVGSKQSDSAIRSNSAQRSPSPV